MVLDGFDKQKQALLSSNLDRSKKGSVDSAIQPLVDLINSRKNFYTTSSCAGRTVLIQFRSKRKDDAAWLFTSHDYIAAQDLISILKGNANILDYPVWFMSEPPILHVCCRSFDDARTFLVIAKESGFKRAGIISFGRRIMIEMIGSQRIDAPIIEDKTILVSDGYLALLADKANQAMKKNRSDLERFRKKAEAKLF